MYALLIDAGNTRIKWRLLAQVDNQLHSHSEGVFSGEVAEQQCLAWPSKEAVQKVLLASVVEQPVLQQTLSHLYAEKLHWLPHPLPAIDGFQHCYAHPERLGVDRWLAMLGARTHCQQDLLVVDAGTALTIDLLQANNDHLGGYIVPGAQMAQAALFDNTAKVKPFADDQKTGHIAPGQSTYACVQAGIQRQRVALVQSVLADFPNYQPFVCGGDGDWIAQQLNLNYYNNLVLDGMESLCVGYF